MQLPPGEPDLGPWRAASLSELVSLVLANPDGGGRDGDGPDGDGRDGGRRGDVGARPRVVAVDGRSASGKSTLAARILRQVPRCAVVHVDDLAWWEPLYEWGHLLADGVLRPLRQGRAVSFRPPAWQERGREGAIELPAGLDVVVVEGTGASHAEHAELVDVTVWVQSDVGRAEERGIARDVEQGVNGDLAEATAFWHDWMRAELAFFERQRPWERARVVVNGTPSTPPAEDEVLIAVPAR